MLKRIIEQLYIRFCGDIPEDNFTAEEEMLLLEELSLVNENFVPYLKFLLKRDKERYFNANEKARERIKGEYSRTLYLIKMTQAAEELTNKRYG